MGVRQGGSEAIGVLAGGRFSLKRGGREWRGAQGSCKNEQTALCNFPIANAKCVWMHVAHAFAHAEHMHVQACGMPRRGVCGSMPQCACMPLSPDNRADVMH